MKYKLSDKHTAKRAFITGGGGGLGRAIALALAGDGWTIGITDIKQEALAESKNMIENAGGKAFTYQFDVSKREDFQKAFDSYIQQTGGIDLMINNAGVGDGGLFGEYGLDNWEWITAVSYTHLDVYKRQKKHRSFLTYFIALKNTVSLLKIIWNLTSITTLCKTFRKL